MHKGRKERREGGRKEGKKEGRKREKGRESTKERRRKEGKRKERKKRLDKRKERRKEVGWFYWKLERTPGKQKREDRLRGNGHPVAVRRGWNQGTRGEVTDNSEDRCELEHVAENKTGIFQRCLLFQRRLVFQRCILLRTGNAGTRSVPGLLAGTAML